MDLIKDVPLGKNQPEEINVVIEITKGSTNKYEYDEDLKVMALDRVLHSPLHYPTDYGFVPQTHGEDGDSLDVLVLTDAPVIPGCVVRVRPIGILDMEDDAGQDDKIIAVQVDNPRFKEMNELTDVDKHTLKEIEHFFAEYKKLEEKEVTVKGWGNKKQALAKIEEAAARFTSN